MGSVSHSALVARLPRTRRAVAVAVAGEEQDQSIPYRMFMYWYRYEYRYPSTDGEQPRDAVPHQSSPQIIIVIR
jgi:hypothetical protein